MSTKEITESCGIGLGKALYVEKYRCLDPFQKRLIKSYFTQFFYKRCKISKLLRK